MTDTPTPVATPKVAKSSSVHSKLDEIVDQWHRETFPGSLVGNSVELWNFVLAAKDDLKQRIKETA